MTPDLVRNRNIEIEIMWPHSGLGIEKHSRISEDLNNYHTKANISQLFDFFISSFLLWILYNYIFENKRHYFITDFMIC